MAAGEIVRPNRRGARSREVVLDAAERVMAEHGYDGASIARIVTASGVPASSVYHYFDSKEGVLLAVMQRGAERFFDALPATYAHSGVAEEDLATTMALLTRALSRHPDFLRLLLVMAAQPLTAATARQVHDVITGIRAEALGRLRRELGVVLAIPPAGRTADRLARFAMATVDGAFVAGQADGGTTFAETIEDLPAALLAVHARLAA